MASPDLDVSAADHVPSSSVKRAPSSGANVSHDGPEVVLTPKLSARWALSLPHVVVCLLFATLFLTLNYLPLFFSDIWGHVSYGERILQTGELPTEDPFVPLAEGVPLLDSAWLSQVVFAAVERWGGAEGLSGLYAVVVCGSYLVFWRMCYLMTGRLWLSVAGTGLLLVLASSRILVIRPEIFAMLCCAILLWTMSATRRKPDDPPVEDSRRWFLSALVIVPLTMAVWANFHGSFVVGIGILGCHFLGRAIDVFLTERSPYAVFADRWTRRWLVLTELGVVGTLLNPYGIDLWLHALSFSANPNVQNILEWQPLSLQVPEASRFFIAGVLLLFVIRHSRRRMRAAEVLLLAAFAAAVVMAARMMSWYAAVFVFVLLPHAQSALEKLSPRFAQRSSGPWEIRGGWIGPSFRHTAMCLTICWITFALSSFATPLLGGTPRTAEKLYHPDTPRGVSEFLRENPPEGQIWNPQWWGDWLVWDGPADLRPFMTTNSIHAVPPQVWTDYEQIAQTLTSNWPVLLDKYDVSTVVIDKREQPSLNTRMRGMSRWKIVYEDEQGVVLEKTARAEPEDAEAEDAG